MRKFKGLFCSVSMAALLLFSGMGVSAEETETTAATETAAATEVETEAAADPAAISIGDADGISASDRQALESYAQASIEMVVTMTDAQIEEQLHPTSLLAIVDDSVAASLESWKSVKEELGTYKGIKSHQITATDDEIVIKSACEFENMDGEVTTTLSRKDLSMEGMTFSTGDVSFGRKMQEAAMNTVMGIGIVFCVLLFLSFLISQFKHIAKLEGAATKKKAAPAAPKAAPVPAPAAPVVEETVDDTELIAVIAAAIAAAEGTSPDGFVVRSIKKHNRNKWQRA